MVDLSFIVSRLDFYSIIDILLVALIFYWVLQLIQGTQAVQLLRGMLVIVVLAVMIASFFSTFTAFRWLLDKLLPTLLISIPIIFQPELRRALDRLGSTSRLFARSSHTEIEKTVDAVVNATTCLSNSRHGALIVFERNTGLADYVETGVPLDAAVTSELLMTIFFPNTALHDGGIIIQHNRVVAASTVFPLGNSPTVSKQLLGTRHRAALGITQNTDAIAVVVSEETGIVSLAIDGELLRNFDERRLKQTLKQLHQSPHLSINMPGQETSPTISNQLNMTNKTSRPIRKI